MTSSTGAGAPKGLAGVADPWGVYRALLGLVRGRAAPRGVSAGEPRHRGTPAGEAG